MKGKGRAKPKPPVTSLREGTGEPEVHGMTMHEMYGDSEDFTDMRHGPTDQYEGEPPMEIYDDGDMNEVEQGRRERRDFYRNRDYRDY